MVSVDVCPFYDTHTNVTLFCTLAIVQIHRVHFPECAVLISTLYLSLLSLSLSRFPTDLSIFLVS